MTEWRWGRAGQRLTDAERMARAAAVGLRAARRRQEADAERAEARRHWEAGGLAPWRITEALGDRYGPEVDRACGVEEPTVDHWELGIVYPRFAEVLALAQLTGYSPVWLCRPQPELLASDTSLRFHLPARVIERMDEAASRQFLPDAIASTLRAEGVIS